MTKLFAMQKLLMAVLLSICAMSAVRAAQKRVVVIVWDGMRPDFVNETNTPALHELATRGVFFAKHHSVYLTSTEVNGTALATGDYPQHSGVIGNREFRPDIDALAPIDTESLEAMRKADEQGKYLAVSTLAEILHTNKLRTAIAGTKPVVLLHDRAARPENATSTIVYEGKAMPSSIQKKIVDALGPFPEENGSKTNLDLWTTRALTEQLWRKDVPAFSLLWLAEPDNTQHGTGVGSARALAAIRHSDSMVAKVIATLKAKKVYESTDIFIVSDHGFSTTSGTVNVVARLRRAGFTAVREFAAPPKNGDVLVVGLGGSVMLYVIGHDELTIGRLVNFLQTEDSVGAIFTERPREGTLPLSNALIQSAQAPDIAFSLRWTAETNANGAAGFVISESEGSNPGPSAGLKGTHVSLSPFDLHNTLVATGPDFKKGFVDQTPSGNIDVAPTILQILGVKPPQPMDGRVLSEALKASEANPPMLRVKREQVDAHAKLPTGEWKQQLIVTEVNGVRYLEEGTGEFVKSGGN